MGWNHQVDKDGNYSCKKESWDPANDDELFETHQKAVKNTIEIKRQDVSGFVT